MSNSKRGEIGYEIDGERHILRISTNEWCALEDLHDKPTNELLAEFMTSLQAERLNMRFVRSFFWAAMLGENPDATEKDAGVVMSDLGLTEAAGLLGRAIAASMPDAKEGNENPPKAGKAGTGKNSKSSSPRSGTTPQNSGE